MKKLSSFALFASILFFSGCSEKLTVLLPYEREAFAQTSMQSDLFSARDEFNNEFMAIREGVGFAKAGFMGGCGCK